MRQRMLNSAILFATLLPLAAGSLFADANADKAKEIQAALVDKLGGDSGKIQVAFFDGKAVLSGKVVEDWTQELAKEVALWVPGVTKVENQIEAEKERSVGSGKMIAETGDATLENEVKEALRKEIGSQYAGDVEIEVCDGVVSLRGKSPDAARHDLSVKAAGGIKKVTKVIDLLRHPA
jgi:hypothetical protein